jgi:hypothetical protein
MPMLTAADLIAILQTLPPKTQVVSVDGGGLMHQVETGVNPMFKGPDGLDCFVMVFYHGAAHPLTPEPPQT